MTRVHGSKGYETAIEQFAQGSFKLKFADINQDFLPFLPSSGASILDAGCGVGQNAAALSDIGFKVTAVEPLAEFLQLAKQQYAQHKVNWVHDSLPALKQLETFNNAFDFILMDGVWHHLETDERQQTICRLAELLKPQGMLAVSLRNGPAGLGTHVFPTSAAELICLAQANQLKPLLCLENQPSKMKNKPKVFWSRVVVQKITGRI